MNDRLDLHPASAAERTEAFRNVHDVWGHGLPLEEHMRRRTANPKFSNANWYVGCLDGRVVTSCGCYQVTVRMDGSLEPACAVGSVHTLAEFRGRGFAPKLLAFAENQEQSAGKTFSLLYSDIGATYYERLGYRRCTANQGWVNPNESQVDQPRASALVRFDPAHELGSLMELYSSSHARLSLWIARSEAYWRYLLAQSPEDEFYFADAEGQRAFIRLGIRNSEMVIRDHSLVDGPNRLTYGVYLAVIRLAKSRGAARVGGWVPDNAVSRELFDVGERVQEMTMIKPLVDRIKVDERHFAAADHFHEIDHV